MGLDRGPSTARCFRATCRALYSRGLVRGKQEAAASCRDDRHDHEVQEHRHLHCVRHGEGPYATFSPALYARFLAIALRRGARFYEIRCYKAGSRA